MLKLLLKRQMTEIFRSFFYNAKKNEARTPVSTAVYIALFVILMVFVVGGVSAALSFFICGPLVSAGMDWLYFALNGLLSVAFGAFGSVFNTFSSLYLSKDNDLLLSLPIPVHIIMTSRLLGVYLMGLMYSGTFILPPVIVYWLSVPMNAAGIVGSLWFVFLISVFVFTLSCALGWVVAKISVKIKNKSFVTVFVSLLFFAVYYLCCFKAQSLISDFIANASKYGDKIKGSVYPVYLFGRAGTGETVSLLVITAVFLLLLGIVWFGISKSFLKIATSPASIAKKAYKETDAKQKGIFGALLSKEFSRFTSSPNYMLNCGFGIVMAVITGIALIWKGKLFFGIIGEILGSNDSLPAVICIVVCLVSAMNNMAAPSVSLEGKSIWLLQSLPVPVIKILTAKLAVQLILTGVPMLFCIACSLFAYGYAAAELLLVVLICLSYCVYTAVFGLFMGLLMPNVNWTNETTPIKQSGCVAFSLLNNVLYTVIMFVVFMVLRAAGVGFVVFAAVFTALSLALSFAIYSWIGKKGCEVFSSL